MLLALVLLLVHDLSIDFVVPDVSVSLDQHEEFPPDGNVEHDCQLEEYVANLSANVDTSVVNLVIYVFKVVSSIICPNFNRILNSSA